MLLLVSVVLLLTHLWYPWMRWFCWLRLSPTAQKMKFSIKEFFSKCDQIQSFLWILSHLMKKSLMETSFFVQRPNLLSLLKSHPFLVLSVEFFISSPWSRTISLNNFAFFFISLILFLMVTCSMSSLVNCNMFICTSSAYEKFEYGHMGSWYIKSTLCKRFFRWNKIFKKIK